MELLLHLGMPKTGSKALQSTLDSNPEPLADAGLRFAQAGRGRLWHQPLFRAGDSLAACAEEIRAELQLAPRLLFSYEAGYRADRETIDHLRRLAPLRALLFVRDPVAWVNSHFNQLVKAHRTTYADILGFDVGSARLQHQLDVRRHLDRWFRAVPDLSLRVAPYTRSTSVTDVVLEWAGVDSRQRACFTPPPSGVNSALGLDDLRLLIEVKRQLADSDEATLVEVMNYIHASLEGRLIDTRRSEGTAILSGPEKAAVAARFTADYQALLTDFGSPDPGSLVDDRRYAETPRRQLFSPGDQDRSRAAQLIERARSAAGA
ncbi:MAG: hypothetical protein HKN26_08465 [Acidimicrobiales bacterium]|nr:hypothetical protein [Acidimicrobiales bacterium]